MTGLRQLFSKYTGALRSFKLIYMINNLFNQKKLQHNKALYKKYGIRKSIFGPIGSRDLKGKVQEQPWLDRPQGREALRAHPYFATLEEELQQQLLQFTDQGYMILRGFYSEEEVEQLNGTVDQLLEAQKANYNYTGRKIMDAFRASPLVDQQFFRNPRLLELLEFTMGRKIVPFQTINFTQGSEQRAHSDSIHMTTEPEGYLIASWTALEDIDENSGPLFYYPGSHQMPYVTCQDYQSGNTQWTIGDESYKRYEDKIEAILAEKTFEKQYFLAKKGDVLIWHANLLHGGSPIKDERTTRKSMVAHYFCEGVICYHEISQRPALLELE
ncbi:MAG: phytanoyl-CoA dioxygenase family protein [Bacteroidota bacterium]